jgi:hypothetical protein
MAKIMRCAYRSEDALSHTSGEVVSGSVIVLKVCVSINDLNKPLMNIVTFEINRNTVQSFYYGSSCRGV